MIRLSLVIFCVVLGAWAAPQQVQHRSRRPVPLFRETTMGGLKLPNNATAIRENIVDTFSCENRIYGYYADIDNECQIFHVCMPQNRGAIRWSFICPESTVFNQATFVCTWTDDSIPCEESENYYELNQDFGREDDKNPQNPEEATYPPDYGHEPNNELPVTPFYGNSRGRGRGNNRRGKSYSEDTTTQTALLIDMRVEN